MRIQRESPLRVVITPHEGGRCTHRIVVVGFPTYGVDLPPVHATLVWEGSQGPLGVASSREYANALVAACDIADQMARNGDRRVTPRAKNILGSAWRSSVRHHFGIVAVRRVDGWKAYLGLITGRSTEIEDELLIAEWGAPLMEAEARAFFPQFAELPYAT